MLILSDTDLITAANHAATLEAKIKQLEAQRAMAMHEAGKGFAETLHEHQGALDKIKAALQRWSLAFRDRFAKGKTYDAAGHKLAFRASPPAVGVVDGWKEEQVVEQLMKMQARGREHGASEAEQQAGEAAGRYLRFKPELDKDAILAGLNDATTRDYLRSLGLTVERRETWSFTANLPKPPKPNDTRQDAVTAEAEAAATATLENS